MNMNDSIIWLHLILGVFLKLNLIKKVFHFNWRISKEGRSQGFKYNVVKQFSLSYYCDWKILLKIAHPGLLYGTLNNTVQLINLPSCYQNHGLQDFDKA